jgi:hypothetical protein
MAAVTTAQATISVRHSKLNESDANAALERARGALEEVRATSRAALAAGDFDAAMVGWGDVIAAHRRVLAAQVDVDLAAPPRGVA